MFEIPLNGNNQEIILSTLQDLKKKILWYVNKKDFFKKRHLGRRKLRILFELKTFCLTWINFFNLYLIFLQIEWDSNPRYVRIR